MMDRRSEIRRIVEEVISERSRDNNTGNHSPHPPVSRGEADEQSQLGQSQATSQTRLCMYYIVIIMLIKV